MQIRLVETFRMIFGSKQRLLQRTEPRLDLSTAPAALRQQRKQVGAQELSPRRSQRRKTLAHLRNAFFLLPSSCSPPPLQHRPNRAQVGKAMLGRQDQAGLHVL